MSPRQRPPPVPLLICSAKIAALPALLTILPSNNYPHLCSPHSPDLRTGAELQVPPRQDQIGAAPTAQTASEVCESLRLADPQPKNIPYPHPHRDRSVPLRRSGPIPPPPHLLRLSPPPYPTQLDLALAPPSSGEGCGAGFPGPSLHRSNPDFNISASTAFCEESNRAPSSSLSPPPYSPALCWG